MNIDSSLSATQLMEQAAATADVYLYKGIKDIDAALGEGYAKEHPELLAGYMQAAAADFQATFLANSFTELSNTLSYSIADLTKAVEVMND